jgi:hypothetical protein
MRLIGYVARIGEKRNACRKSVGSQKESDNYDDEDVDGFIWLRLGISASVNRIMVVNS